MIVKRILVGHISDTYAVIDVNANDIEPLPTTKHNSTAHEYSVGMIAVTITAIAANKNATNNNNLRLKRCIRNCESNLPAIRFQKFTMRSMLLSRKASICNCYNINQ